VVDVDASRARAVAQKLGAPAFGTSLDELVGSGIDAVWLAVPNDQHAALAIRAAQLGFHVLVEKPMATSASDASAMISAAHNANVLLAVGHCMAWAPPIERAIALVAAGKIGRPLGAFVAAGFDSPPAGSWRQQLSAEDGGGPLLDLGSHAIDALLRLLGPVSDVLCRLDRVRYDYPAEDTATLILRFDSGAHGLVQTTFTMGQNDLVLQGTGGRLDSSEWMGRDFAGNLRWHSAVEGVGRFSSPARKEAGVPISLERRNVYDAQVHDVCDAIRNGTETRISARAGAMTIAVIGAAVRSAREGRSVRVGDSDMHGASRPL